MALKYPATTDELKAEGFVYDDDGTCRGCRAPIEWWITKGGKPMLMSIIRGSDRAVGIQAMMKDQGDKRQPHFIDCPEASSFRRK